MPKTKIKNANTGGLISIKNALGYNKIGEILVLKGYITPLDLKFALHTQKETQKPLGKIFVEQCHITKYQLARLLFRQRIIRTAATIMLCLMSFSSAAKKSHATEIKDVPARIALASANTGKFKKIKYYPDLFGANETRSTNLKAFTKWSDMFNRFDKALSSGQSKKIVKNLQAELIQFKSSSIHEMASQVNAMMNKQKYIVDNKNWGKSDYWATPIEFMARGGDCEDFAIAKYAALRAMGVPEDRMRLAIVQDQIKNIPHAILVVYSEKGTVILDNQIKAMKSADSITHYKPIFSINREAWWLHTTQEKTTTIIASAQ